MRNTQPSTTIHGVFMNLFNLGTLLVGKSGMGKSDLALALIDRGHQLIADDAVEFNSPDGATLVGHAPVLLRNLLEIRGCGVLDVRAHFGEHAVLKKQTLSLVIALEESSSPTHTLSVTTQPYILCNIRVPCFTLPLTATRPREALVETLVRNYKLTQQGIHTPMQFIANHRHALRASS